MDPNHINPQHHSTQQAPAEQNSGQALNGQTQQAGQQQQAAPGGNMNNQAAPAGTTGQTGQNQAAAPGAMNNQTAAPGGMSGQQPVGQTSPMGTTTDTSMQQTGTGTSYGGMPVTATSTSTAAPSGYTLPPPATFLGMPVDSLIIFTPLFMAGVLVFAWLSGRQPHTEQLSRLDKQRKRMEAREAAKPESVDIFKNEKDDFLGKMLSQAGLEAQYDQMKSKWIMSAVGGLVGMFALCMWQAQALAPFSIFLGPALGSFGFVQYVKWLAGERQKKLTQQLPQILETMVSTLKAGSPVVECIKLLSETAPDPIRSEFKRALISMQLGKPFRDVLAEMGTRIRTADFKLLTQAIFISQDVGANLADVVAVIAEAIRERFRLRDFLNSLTAQGKMTALFIGSLPYFITAMTYVMAPGYITPFLNHPIARIVFIVMMLWEALGAWILLKMTTFEV